MNYLFNLHIAYKSYTIDVKKSFYSGNRKNAFKKARKWMDNCLAICGKDDNNELYLDAELTIGN